MSLIYYKYYILHHKYNIQLISILLCRRICYTSFNVVTKLYWNLCFGSNLSIMWKTCIANYLNIKLKRWQCVIHCWTLTGFAFIRVFCKELVYDVTIID